MRLANKVALITGGGRGIGEAIALAMAREGARLALAARTAIEVEQVAGRVRSGGGQAVAMAADVSRLADVERLVALAMDTYGQVDILVNAAGVYGPIGPGWEVDVDGWVHAMEINLFGTFMCCHEALPHMIERRQGKIINFSGGGATSPLPRFTAYGVSKAAIVRLTETLAEETKPYNIQINSIAPGAIDTKLQNDVLSAGEKAGDLLPRIREMRETGKGGTPRELPAELAVFLASAESDGLTGKLIAAPYDGWQQWDAARIEELMELPWFTLRRMDPFSIKPFVGKLAGNSGG
jgi:NAD(P)-dependent dehydrogenase (short-subunit alcohol dehydrogenase family)